MTPALTGLTEYKKEVKDNIENIINNHYIKDDIMIGDISKKSKEDTSETVKGDASGISSTSTTNNKNKRRYNVNYKQIILDESGPILTTSLHLKHILQQTEYTEHTVTDRWLEQRKEEFKQLISKKLEITKNNSIYGKEVELARAQETIIELLKKTINDLLNKTVNGNNTYLNKIINNINIIYSAIGNLIVVKIKDDNGNEYYYRLHHWLNLFPLIDETDTNITIEVRGFLVNADFTPNIQTQEIKIINIKEGMENGGDAVIEGHLMVATREGRITEEIQPITDDKKRMQFSILILLEGCRQDSSVQFKEVPKRIVITIKLSPSQNLKIEEAYLIPGSLCLNKPVQVKIYTLRSEG